MLQSLVSHVDKGCASSGTAGTAGTAGGEELRSSNAGSVESTQPEFRVALYALLFECLKDSEDWSLGLTLSSDALARVPMEWRRPIWQYRVSFMSKMGMGVDISQLKINDNDRQTQAKLWQSLARSCASTLDQFNFILKAIDSVTPPASSTGVGGASGGGGGGGGGGSGANSATGTGGNTTGTSDSIVATNLDRVEYLIQYAEWLYVNQFGGSDAEDQLYAAADILHDST